MREAGGLIATRNWLCESPAQIDEVSGVGFDLKIMTVLYHSLIQQATVEQTALMHSQHVMCRPSRSSRRSHSARPLSVARWATSLIDLRPERDTAVPVLLNVAC